MKKQKKKNRKWQEEKQMWEDAAAVDTLKALGDISKEETDYYEKLGKKDN